MAAAADALARSAQSRPGDPVPSWDAAANFRGVASIVAQSQLSNKSPMAWAMLIDQLGRTLRTIGEAHAARGETEIARALVDNLSQELELLHDRFETSSPRELLPGEQMADNSNPLSGYEMDMYEMGMHDVAHHRGRESNHDRGFER
jgi:hypothetical protein